MKSIQYLVTYSDGHNEKVTVQARNINAGMRKALDRILSDVRTSGLSGNWHWEIARIEFWAVV